MTKVKLEMPRASQLYEGLKLLSPLSRSSTKGRERLVSMRPASLFAESFRLLALNLRVMLADNPVKGIVVMSAYQGDGRSTVAANLAIALAEHSPVLLVDSETAEQSPLQRLLAPRRPDSAASRPSSLPATTYATDHPGLWLLNGAGPATNGALTRLESIVNEASTDGVITIVDSPPAVTSTTSFVLGREVGQAIYVVRNRVQDMGIHRRIREQLKRLGIEILGLVTNEI